MYLLHFLRDGFLLTYVGMTAVFVGQSDRAALEQRRRHHLDEPVSWLKGLVVESLFMRAVTTNILRRADAFAEEARVAALQCKALGTQVVRGGPWCLRGLSAADRREIDMVAACESRAAVHELGRRLRVGSLAVHLAGGRYKCTSPRAGSSGKVVLPLAAPWVRRSSSRSGRSGSSGKTSGVSGHEYRLQAGLVHGTSAYVANKYGRHPKQARNRAQAKYRSKSRGT